MSFALTTICTCICRYLSSAWSTILIYDAYTVPYCTWFERKKEGEYAMPNHAQPRFMSGHFDPLWWKMFYKCASPELWCPMHQSTSAKHALDISHQLNQAAVKHKTCGFSKQLWIVGHAVIWFERKVHNIFPAASDTETNWRTFIYKWNPFLWHFQASSMDVPIVETHRQVASNAVEKCAKNQVEAKLPWLSLITIPRHLCVSKSQLFIGRGKVIEIKVTMEKRTLKSPLSSKQHLIFFPSNYVGLLQVDIEPVWFQ